MNSTFIGREAELDLLDRLWERSGATLLISRPAAGWQDQAVYALAAKTSVMRPDSDSRAGACYPRWPTVLGAGPTASVLSGGLQLRQSRCACAHGFHLRQLESGVAASGCTAQGERLAFFIDEFTYLLEIDPRIAGQLQNLWDHTLSRTNLFLVICGSIWGSCAPYVVVSRAPLRAGNGTMRPQPLPFGATARDFPDYDADKRVAIYAIWGGIPAYWERGTQN